MSGKGVQVKQVQSSECEGLTYDTEKIIADRSCHKVNSPEAAADPSPAEEKFVAFVLGHELSEKALWRAKVAILDTCAISAAGQGFPSSEILKEYAKQEHGGRGGRLLYGAGEVSRTGAAFAFAQQCECVDAHDGLNRSNAHISATLLPAMFAFAEPDTPGDKFIEAFAIGLEAFVYCSDSLEVEEGKGYIYLPGGLKAGFGAVAGVARLLQLDALTLRHACGIYELHGPRVQTHAGLRVTMWPTMLRDTMAWAAHAAVSAIQLARLGFTGIPCGIFKLASFDMSMERPPTCLEYPGLYMKTLPACRWAHAYVFVLKHILEKNHLSGSDVESCHVNAERGGAALGEGVDYSVNVDEAHYDLKWPLAAQIVEWPRPFGIRLSNPIAMQRDDIREMCKRITIDFDNGMSNISFSRELSVKLKDGTVLKASVDDILPREPEHAEGLRINFALDDQYVGIMTDKTFRTQKFQPYAEYGVGTRRANEIWDAVEDMSNGGTCAALINALTRPLDVDRDEEGGAVDRA